MRTFGLAVLACPSCAGRMRLLAMVTEPRTIARFLRALGEPTDVPPRAPARGPPYWKSQVIAQYACSMHTVESARTAAARDAVGRPPDVLVQVNVAGEASKHGVAPAHVAAIRAELALLPNLRVVGLMTLPPPHLGAAERAFATLADLARASALPYLSMGMSDDLELAIAHGATHVRIGTAIFGERL